jgi:endogenous inhibitor of DNA gyrase (YacG/DUF329 family)
MTVIRCVACGEQFTRTGTDRSNYCSDECRPHELELWDEKQSESESESETDNESEEDTDAD